MTKFVLIQSESYNIYVLLFLYNQLNIHQLINKSSMTSVCVGVCVCGEEWCVGVTGWVDGRVWKGVVLSRKVTTSHITRHR